MPADPARTPMGAQLTDRGATFRLWAPQARRVVVRGSFNGWSDCALTPAIDGHWFAFVPGVAEQDEYLFFVEGIGTTGTSAIRTHAP